jgi:hypothetical protein
MSRLVAEIERIRGQIRETARFACHMSDSMARSGALTPKILHEAQTALRQNLLFIEKRQRTLETRRKPRARVLKRRFARSEFFRDYRAKHIQLLQDRDDCLEWQRNLLRQIGDTLAWIVLRGDPVSTNSGTRRFRPAYNRLFHFRVRIQCQAQSPRGRK